jgi:hypothetical protein
LGFRARNSGYMNRLMPQPAYPASIDFS